MPTNLTPSGAIPPESFYAPIPKRKRTRTNENEEETAQQTETPAEDSNDTAAPHTPPPQETDPNAPLKETPRRHSASGFNPYTSMHYTKVPRHRQLEREMRDKFVGPMPARVFLRKFLPVPREDFSWSKASQKSLKKAASCSGEVPMYAHLIDGLKEYSTTYNIVDTHAVPDSVTWAREPIIIKPDITTYAQGVTLDRKTDLSQAEFTIEVKIKPGDDAFCDPDNKEKKCGADKENSDKKKRGVNKKNADKEKQSDPPFERDTAQGRDTRGQITAYATAQLATQFRTHVFSLLIVKGGARFIRWDRSGAVVSHKFDYSKDQYLAEFFWRYDRVTAECHGVDLSVTRPLPEDAALVEEARTALQIGEKESVHKFEVYNDDTGVRTYYLGGKPTFRGNGSPTGRATRCLPVYDTQRKRVVYLKDTWRVVGENIPILKEGETYKLLKESNVSNIATVVACGDVMYQEEVDGSPVPQTTRTQKCQLRRLKDGLGTFRTHTHYRLVFDEIGRDLTSFDNVWEVVSAIADAVQAHKEAYENARILHRDISVGNIIITDDGRGLLIDWDLSKPVSELGVARQVERTGTWQFMSARLLMSPTPLCHELADDLESFYHVLGWVVLRFTPHGLDTAPLSEAISLLFDQSWYDDITKTATGGTSKGQFLIGEWFKDRAELPPGVLHDLISDLASVLRVRYLPPPTAEEVARFEKYRDMLPPGFLGDQVVWKYNQAVEQLKDSTWIAERFHEAAKHKDKLTAGRFEHVVMSEYPASVIGPKSSSAFVDDARPVQRLKHNHLLLAINEEVTWAPGAPDLQPEEVEEEEAEEEDFYDSKLADSGWESLPEDDDYIYVPSPADEK